MIKVNYKSDFKINERSERVAMEVPFVFSYYVFGSKRFVASFDGENYVNCERKDDGSLDIIFNNPDLGIGPLKVERKYAVDDKSFADGVFDIITVEKTGVFLTSGQTFENYIQTLVVPPYLKGDKGEPMRWETMTEVERGELVKDVAEAIDPEMVMTENEQARIQAERDRVAAENSRANVFGELKTGMEQTIEDGKAATEAAEKVVEEYDGKVAVQDEKLSELGSKADRLEQKINLNLLADVEVGKVDGYYLDGGSKITIGNGMCYTELIHVSKGDVLYLDSNPDGSISVWVLYADINRKEVISKKIGTGTEVLHFRFEAQEEGYVSFSGKSDSLSVYKTSRIIEEHEVRFGEARKDINEIASDVKEVEQNVNNIKKIIGESVEVELNKVVGFYVDSKGEVVNSTNKECYAIFHVNKGDEIVYSSTINGSLCAIGFSESETLLQGSNVDIKVEGIGSGETITLTHKFENEGYAVVSGNTADIMVLITFGGTLDAKISELDEKIAKNQSDGQSEIKAIKRILNKLDVSIDTGNIDKSVLLETGDIAADPGYRVTLPIYIDNPCKLSVTSKCGAISAKIALYNSNVVSSENYIGGVKGNSVVSETYVYVDKPSYIVLSFVPDKEYKLPIVYKDESLYYEDNQIKQGLKTILTIDENPQDIAAPKSAVASSSSVASLNKHLGFEMVNLDKDAHKGHYIATSGKEGVDSKQTYCYIPIKKGDKVFCYSNPDGYLIAIAFTLEKSLDNLIVGARSAGQRVVTYFEAASPIDGYAIVGGVAETLYAGKVSALKNDLLLVPFKGTLKEVGSRVVGNSFFTKEGNKYASVQQFIGYNINNYSGDFPLLELTNDSKALQILLRHDEPSNVLLPQKENTEREENIKYVDFPMAVKQDKLIVKVDDVEETSILLDGRLDMPFVRRVPALTIQYIPNDGVDLSTMRDLKLYITKGVDNIVDKLYIKKGVNTIYEYTFNKDRDIALVWKDIREGLAALSDYKFKLLFGDLENSAVSDILCTKSDGLPFVTEYSDNCLTTGTMIYDNYAVFIEVLDKDLFELEAVVNNGTLFVYLEGRLIYNKTFDFSSVKFGYEGTYGHIVNYDPHHTKANGKRPLLKGLSGHEFSTQPMPANREDCYEDIDGTGFGTPIGAVTYLAHKMRNKGWSNVSIDEVTSYMMDKNYPMPEKCYFIEMDDLGRRQKVNKIFSEEEPYLRQMEIIKMNGIKMCYALMLGADYELFNKIYGGTATDEEKSILTTQMPNEYVYKLRSMIKSYGWGVSLHTFVGPVTHVTSSRYDEVVLAIRNSIKWVERMLEYTPRSYVTDLTGNSSPYFRRVMQMFGIQRVYHDDNNHYSQGRLEGYVDRDGFYTQKNFLDYSYE